MIYSRIEGLYCHITESTLAAFMKAYGIGCVQGVVPYVNPIGGEGGIHYAIGIEE